MNPLTQVKNTQKITAREAALGISDAGSWHAKYKDSAYIYAGGFSFDLTEGDLLAVFAQYGEIVDLNLVRNKDTGKSRGFAFLAYEDQRSTVLAVDNLNGASITGRVIKVDHVANYKKKTVEDEEEEQRRREERGVCRAFQRGQCNRGSSCKFSHNEERCSNTGWGPKEDESQWRHDKYVEDAQQASRKRDDYARRDRDNRLKERERTDGSDRDGGSRWKDQERMEHSDRVRDTGISSKKKERRDQSETGGSWLKERISMKHLDNRGNERGRLEEREGREAEKDNVVVKPSSARNGDQEYSRYSDDGKHRRGLSDECAQHKGKVRDDTEKRYKSRRHDSDSDNEEVGYGSRSHTGSERRGSRKDLQDERDSKHVRR